MDTFATVINCMDGRTQKAVQEYITNVQSVKYVDVITEAGPCKIISDNINQVIIENIKNRVDISINIHKSKYIAIVGHHDCAGVPEDDGAQKKLIINAAKNISDWYPNVYVEAIWFDHQFKIEVIKSF